MRGLFTPFERVISVGGAAVPIDPDFRIMCRYCAALGSKNTEELCECARLFFFAGLPEGVSPEDGANAMTEFYAKGFGCEKEDEKSDEGNKRDKVKKSSKKPPVFDFVEDERYFTAAFLAEYGIDLTGAEMHWFMFCTLFLGLSDECRLKQIMGIRGTDVTGISSRAERLRIKKLQKVFALKANKKLRYKNAAERDEDMKRELRERLAEIEREEGERK